MSREYKSTTHDPKSDESVVKTYVGIDRHPWGASHLLVMGESGPFYCDDIVLGIKAIEQYCFDHYGWNTVQYPIQVTRRN